MVASWGFLGTGRVLDQMAFEADDSRITESLIS